MKFLLDQSADFRLIPYLRDLGHDVTAISRNYPPGLPDEDVLTIAREEARVLIVADPLILAGKPVVKGTRIGVDLVLEELAHNPDINELLAAHPDLTRDDVQACLSYAQAMVTGKDASPKPPKGVRSDAAL